MNTRTATSGSISDDGRLVVFMSPDSDLVPGDTNGEEDVFLRDRLTQTTERVSLSMHGEELAYRSLGGPISADGRFVLFSSRAPNVVPGDTNAAHDVFLRDLQTGAAERVALGRGGTDRTGLLVNYPTISADGRFIAFWSEADNLVPGDTNAAWDVFVEDRLTGTTERVSVSSSGDQYDDASGPNRRGPISISNDGRFVAFVSWAHNLVPDDANQTTDIFLRDRLLSTTERVSLTNWGAESGGESVNCDITPDGRWVVFGSRGVLVAGDVNGWADVYVRDRLLSTTERVNLGVSGEEGNGESSLKAGLGISADGRFVAFTSQASNLVPEDPNHVLDVFLRDRGLQLPLPDVPLGHWAFFDIAACVRAGIVFAYPDGLYHPDSPVARDQMAVFISRALAGGDENVPAGRVQARFDDVPTDHWAYKYVEYCVANDIVQGLRPATYAPAATVSRDAMAVFISRADAGGDGNVPDGPPEATFDDVPTDHWAFKYVEYCVSVDIAQGYHDGYYHPEYTCSRAQMAVFIARAFMLL